MKKGTISAKEIVRKYGISYTTLNYYTAMGLLPVVGKNSNQRMYAPRQVRERLAKIARLSREGYPLHLIRKKLLGI